MDRGELPMAPRRLRIILLCGVVLLVLAFVALLRPRPALYRATVLPSVGGSYLIPYGMNDHGQIVGLAQTTDGDIHLFLWDREKGMQDLGEAVGDYIGINNAGQIAGTMTDPNGEEQAFLWDINGARQLLGMPGEAVIGADAMNDLGQVVGTFATDSDTLHAFLWDPRSGMKDLGPGRACAINNAGQVILETDEGSLLLDLNTETAGIPLPMSGPLSLNNKGWVVGYSPASGAKQEVVMWHRGSPAPKSIQPAGLAINCPINDANQVLLVRTQPAGFRIGRRILFPYRVECYLRDPARGLIPLNRYIHAEPKEYFRPVDLNNKGCILLSSRRRTVLLEPIPERWGKEQGGKR